MSKLYQCPYDLATKCAMEEGCAGCEQFNPKKFESKTIGIIGTGHIDAERITLIEHLVKGVEDKLGVKVEFVDVHSKDVEFLTQKVPIKQIEPPILKTIELLPPSEPKRKGHERPYKYHR